MNNLRRVGINMISGGAGYILPMAINVLAAPYVLRQLGKEAYGLQVLANVIIGYLIVADMGLDIPVTQRIAEYHAKQYPEQQSKFLIATIKIYFLIGLAGGIVLILFTDKLITLLAIPVSIKGDAHMVFYLSAFGFLGSIISMWGKAVFNGFHRYDISNGVNIANNLFSILLGIFLIMKGYGIIGFFSARVGGFLIASMVYIILASKNIIQFTLRPLIDREIWAILKKQVGYGLTLRLSGMIFARTDQTFISVWVGISAVTAYSFPILIATAISGLIASLTHFSFPLVTAMSVTHSKEEIQSFFFKITKFIVSISTLTFFPFIIYGDIFLSLWINPEIAAQNQEVLIFLTIAFYVNSCLTIGLNAFVVGIGELKYFTYYSISRGICLFVGFLCLIKPYGINGAGYSYIIALLVDAIFVLYSLRTKFHFNIAQVFLRGYLKPVLLGIVLSVAMILAKRWVTTWIELIAAIGIYGVLYIVFGYWMGILNESEKNVIKSFLKKFGSSI